MISKPSFMFRKSTRIICSAFKPLMQSVLFVLVSISAMASNTEVDSLVLAVHPHGIGYIEARKLGPTALPRLFEILDEPKHRLHWVNALVVIGFQEKPEAVERLIEFYEKTSSPRDVETMRAHLAVAFALGSIAANEADTQALDYLIEALSKDLQLGVKKFQGTDIARARLE